MSSLRVRAQNKLLSKLGASKPSKNVQFDMSFAAFERTADGIAGLELALRSFSSTMRAFHSSGAMVLQAVDHLAAPAESSDDMKRFVSNLKAAFFQVDTHVASESLARFDKHVLRPAAGWQQRALTLRHEAAVFQDEKLMFDHYTRKVMSLRESRDKRLASGKPEKPKDVEKLMRNEQKLAAATNSYTKMSDDTIRNLRDFVNARETTLTPLLERARRGHCSIYSYPVANLLLVMPLRCSQVLEFRAQYAKRVDEESRCMQELVTHEASVLDKVLGKLEALLPQKAHQTQGEIPSIDTSIEPEVRSFKFEEFTGEAAPHSAKDSNLVATDPLDQIAKRDSVRATAHATAPSFESDEFVPPPPPPPMFSAQFETASGLEKRSSSEFFVPPPPPPQYNTSPSAPTSPASMTMTPWDNMDSSSVPVAVRVFSHESEQLSSSWPPHVSNSDAFSTSTTANSTRQANGDGQCHSSHRSSLTADPSSGMHQFPTNFHHLHNSAMGPGAGAGSGNGYSQF